MERLLLETNEEDAGEKISFISILIEWHRIDIISRTKESLKLFSFLTTLWYLYLFEASLTQNNLSKSSCTIK